MLAALAAVLLWLVSRSRGPELLLPVSLHSLPSSPSSDGEVPMLLSCWAAEWGQVWSFGLGLRAGIIMTPGGAEAWLRRGCSELEMAVVLRLKCVVGGVMDLSLLPGLLEFFLDPPPRYPVCIFQTWDLGAAVSQDLDRDGGLPQPLQVPQLPGALLVPLGTGLSLVLLFLFHWCLGLSLALMAQLHSLPGPGLMVLLLHLHSRGDVQQ